MQLNEFYDKVVLPVDEAIEEELLKKMESEKKPFRSGDESEFTWTALKKLKIRRPRLGTMLLLLWQLMRKDNLFLYETKNIASFGSFVGL
jgi:hypothetical protein